MPNCNVARKSVMLAVFASFIYGASTGQPLAGYWKGKVSGTQGLVKRQWQLELKMVRVGDSIKGQATYSQGNEIRTVPINGYANPANGTITWWDEQVGVTNQPLLSYEVDFNCPGEGIMKLEGTATDQANQSRQWKVILDKQEDADIDESWATITPPVKNEPRPTARPMSSVPIPVASVEEMFVKRSRTLVSEIPLLGDSLVIHFYDHAEIDGDSISLFMNQQLIHKHVLLRASPFTLRLAVKDLADVNELTMVAENLGTIPPNTSLMIAWVDGVRHEARLESTEQTSAMIRFIKPAGAKRLPEVQMPHRP